MRVIVTRPEAESRRWVEQLAAEGFDVVGLPLIAIEPLADLAPLQSAWRTRDAYRALMFVSVAAVRHFFAARPAEDTGPVMPAGTRVWAPGPGTRTALLQHGVAPGQVDSPPSDSAQFDSEHLWQQVSGQVRAQQQVLVLRGAQDDAADDDNDVAAGDERQPQRPRQGAGREWLAQQLRAAGVEVQMLACYRRVAPVPEPARAALAAAAAADGSVWLFTSSQAVDNLRRLCPATSWRQARALATHPRIAAAARHAGFGTVLESRPGLDDVAASIKSLA